MGLGGPEMACRCREGGGTKRVCCADRCVRPARLDLGWETGEPGDDSDLDESFPVTGEQ